MCKRFQRLMGKIMALYRRYMCKLTVSVILFVLLTETFILMASLSSEHLNIQPHGFRPIDTGNYNEPGSQGIIDLIARVNLRFERNVNALGNISNYRNPFEMQTQADDSMDNDVDDNGEAEMIDGEYEYRELIENGTRTFDELADDIQVMIQFPNTTQSPDSTELSLDERTAVFEKYYKPIRAHENVNCSKIAEGNEDELAKTRFIMNNYSRPALTSELYIRMISCEAFKSARGYIEHPLSKMEKEFPLAFGIVLYKDVEQAERLLRAIYRPHNVYCIHVDKTTSHTDFKAVERIASCFDNIHIVKDRVDVEWGKFSVLEAEMKCLEAVEKYPNWKYYINLTGQEFPLKTNRELVAILSVMGGANIVDGTWIRARHKYLHRWIGANRPPPHRIWPIKGSIHVAINRHFVNFSLHDNRAQDFLEWLRNTSIPDETFFASLNHNPHLGIKGSFLGDAEEYALKPSFMRYKNWEIGHNTYIRPCSGKYVRNICIIGIGDIQRAFNDIGLFVNKFHIDFEPLALDCLEELLHQKTWQQFIDETIIDVTFYKHLDFTKLNLSK